MNYYFIDYENVKNNGLNGIDFLSENDVVYIFYSANADSMTFETHRKLMDSPARINYERVNVGSKNALDFQLSTFLGYIVGQNAEEDVSCFLITKDTGFGIIVKFWHSRGKNVFVAESVREAAAMTAGSETVYETVFACDTEQVYEAEAAQTAAALETAVPATVEEALVQTACSPDDIAAIKKIIGHYKTKSGINNALVKQFQSKRAGEIYRAIKPFIKDKKGSEPKTKQKSDVEIKLEEMSIDKAKIPVIVKIIQNYKTKVGINNALMKQFPSPNHKESAEIYNVIKPLLTDKKGN